MCFWVFHKWDKLLPWRKVCRDCGKNKCKHPITELLISGKKDFNYQYFGFVVYDIYRCRDCGEIIKKIVKRYSKK
jgi:uncharacterized Zn finger protein